MQDMAGPMAIAQDEHILADGYKSMLADGFVSEFDFLDDKVDAGMGCTTPSFEEKITYASKRS